MRNFQVSLPGLQMHPPCYQTFLSYTSTWTILVQLIYKGLEKKGLEKKRLAYILHMAHARVERAVSADFAFMAYCLQMHPWCYRAFLSFPGTCI
jgi:hypothetical protein